MLKKSESSIFVKQLSFFCSKISLPVRGLSTTKNLLVGANLHGSSAAPEPLAPPAPPPAARPPPVREVAQRFDDGANLLVAGAVVKQVGGYHPKQCFKDVQGPF